MSSSITHKLMQWKKPREKPSHLSRRGKGRAKGAVEDVEGRRKTSADVERAKGTAKAETERTKGKANEMKEKVK